MEFSLVWNSQIRLDWLTSGSLLFRMPQRLDCKCATTHGLGAKHTCKVSSSPAEDCCLPFKDFFIHFVYLQILARIQEAQDIMSNLGYLTYEVLQMAFIG